MKTFSIKRFWKYFAFDFHSAKREQWINILICGLMPLIMYIMQGVFTLIIKGSWDPSTTASKITAILAAYISIILAYSTKVYGILTDKKKGSDWLLLPASTLEKFTSAMLMSLVVVPAVTAALFFGVDELMALCIPGYSSILSFNLQEKLVSLGMIMPESNYNIFNLNWGLVFYANFCEYMLIFLLGAICFKKAKIVKTFLAAWGGSIVLGIITAPLMKSTTFNDMLISSAPEAFATARILIRLFYIAFIALLAGGIYYRMRTLKH